MEEHRLVVSRSWKSETENCWSDLPPDLCSLVLSKLFLRDRCNFKLVCKSWKSILPIPPSLPPPVDSPHFDSPCLMFSMRSNSSWKLFHSLYNDLYYLDFPELMDAEIRFSKYGWLLMSRENGPLFFFNPFTKVKFELPPTTSSFLSVCFTSPPTSSDCFIFGLLLRDFQFGLIKFGEDEWKTGEINNYNYDFWQTDCPPVFHNGTYYWLEFQSRNIRIFDLAKEDECQWIDFDKGDEEDEEEEDDDDEEEEEEEDSDDEEEEEEEDSDDEEDDEQEEDNDDEEEEEEEDSDDEEDDEQDEDEIDESHMLEVEGEIWAVFIRNYGRRQVSVEKLDLSEMRWSKLESIGNKCLYVSTTGSFAETCARSDLANKIYFNKFYHKSGVIYCLSTGMYYSVAGNFASNGCFAKEACEDYGLTRVEHGAWIRPTLLS